MRSGAPDPVEVVLMILESLMQAFYNVILSLFSLFDILSLPSNFISLISNVLVYGIWVVGNDLLSIVIACVVYWFSLRATIGLALFIWRLLPLT